MTRHIESQREQFPFRVASYRPHQDLAESHRAHGTVHTTGGRVIPGWKLAVADTATQQSRLADPTGWTHHSAVTPSPMAVQGARAYASLKGLSDPHDTDYGHIMQSPERVARVGRHYDSLPTYTADAVPHYMAMHKEVGDQYDFLTNRLGIKVQPVDYDPYAHVGEMMADVNNNKTLKVLGSHVTGGHPIFGNEGNNKFRAVHDFFGHAATGRDFDRHGEHATYLAHSRMFSPQAFPALTTETLGQNSSLILNGHFGPNKIGTIPRELTSARITADFDPEEYEFSAEPSGFRTPRWNKDNRPELPDGSRYFAPYEKNPASNSEARPDPNVYWNPTPQPVLPGMMADPGNPEYGSDRIGTELHRGFKLDLGHPDLHAVRRALRGSADEGYYPGKQVPSGWGQFETSEPVLPGMGTKEMSNCALAADPHPRGYSNPELVNMILPHILQGSEHEGLGHHWSLNEDMAGRFAGVFPHHFRQNSEHYPRDRLSVLLSGSWRGLGEDPYRRGTQGDFDDEDEITLLPGAPLSIHQMQIFNPHSGRWHAHDLNNRHHTAGKKKKNKGKKPKALLPGEGRPIQYKHWKGPAKMWFNTEAGEPMTNQDIFERGNYKQIYPLLRNDNEFAHEYNQWLQTQGKQPEPVQDDELPEWPGREFIGFLQHRYPDVMSLLGDL